MSKQLLFHAVKRISFFNNFYLKLLFSFAKLCILILLPKGYWILNLFQVKKLKPHVLLGLSGVGGIFNEEVKSLIMICDFIFFMCIY